MVDSHALPLDVSACLPVSVVMQIASWSRVSCRGFCGGIIVLQLLSFLSEVVAASQVFIAFFFRIISHFFQFS